MIIQLAQLGFYLILIPVLFCVFIFEHYGNTKAGNTLSESIYGKNSAYKISLVSIVAYYIFLTILFFINLWMTS